MEPDTDPQPVDNQESDTATEEPVDSSTGDDTQEPPDWQVILDAAPESLRGELQPVVEQYAQSQAEKLKEIQDQYEPWSPVTQYELDDVQKALNFANYFNENPVKAAAEIREALLNQAGNDEQLKAALIEQGFLEAEIANEPAVEPDDDDVDLDDPAYKKLFSELTGLKEIVTTLAQDRQAEAKQKQESEQKQALDAHLAEVEKDVQFFDRQYVVSRMAHGVTAIAAAKEYEKSVLDAAKKLQQPVEEAPTVLGSGAVPSNQVSPGKMSSLDREKYVADLLRKDAEAAR